MMSVAAIVRLVEQFVPDGAPEAITSHRQTLVLLRTSPRPLDRTLYAPGHCTASAIVLSAPGDAVALIWHARLERWLQPGGHFEPVDRSAVAAARREVAEELGVTLGSAAPLVGVDVHAIPPARGEPAHWHHDLVFGFRLAEDVPLDGGDVPAEWCAVEALGHRGADEPLRRAVARTRLALAGVM